MTISPASRSFSAANQALIIAEVLENILLNLSLVDTLCSAQKVSAFWRNCITGSRTLQHKCLFLPSTTDDYTADNTLYMDFSCPVSAYRDLHTRQIALFQYHIDSPRPSLSKLREFLNRAVHTHFDDYLMFMATMHKSSPNEHGHFNTNSGITYRFFAAMTQLRAAVAHPFVRRYIWAPQECFWTGYRNRLVLLIFDVDKPATGDFVALQKLVNAMLQMVRTCPTVSCLDAPLTRPAATVLTVSLQRPTGNAYNVGLRRSGFVVRNTGVTIRDMLLLLVEVTILLFEEYADSRGQDTMDLSELMIERTRSLQKILN